jgi:antitoxin component HigA of HigAB toxin-antitoxin module
MDNQEIEKLLKQLNKEIEQIQPDDEKGQKLLRELSADIRELLERAELKQPAPSMMSRIETSIEHFEVTHPDLTSALSSLSAILSNAGI